MKIKQKQSHKKVVIFAIIFILLIGGGAVWIFRENLGLVQKKSETKTEKTEEKNDEKSERKKVEKREKENETVVEKNPGTLKQFEDVAEENSAKNQLNSWINLAEFDGQRARIRVTIQEVLGSGSCEISLTNGAKKYSETAQIVANPSSSSCAGFDIAKEKLGGGNWQFNIKITSGERSADLSGEINI